MVPLQPIRLNVHAPDLNGDHDNLSGKGTLHKTATPAGEYYVYYIRFEKKQKEKRSTENV